MNLKKEKNLAQPRLLLYGQDIDMICASLTRTFKKPFSTFYGGCCRQLIPKFFFIKFKINVMSNKVANWSGTDRMCQQCIGWTNKQTVYQRMWYVFHARRARCFSRLLPFNQLIYSSIIKLNKFLIKVQQASNAITQSSECDDFNLSATEFLVIDG